MGRPVWAASNDVPAGGAAKFSFAAAFRGRAETKVDFDFNGGDQDYYLNQIRLDMTYTPSEQTQFFIQLQDARIYGENLNGFPRIDKEAVPNIFPDELT